MKFNTSVVFVGMLAIVSADAQSGETIGEFLEGIVGDQVYSDIIAGAAPSVMSALHSPVGDSIPTLASQLAAGSVPSVFANLPGFDIGLAETIVADIFALPTDVQAFVEASPKLAAPIISAYEAGNPPPPAAISALPSSIVSELIPIYQSIYGSGIVASYLASLSGTTTGLVTAITTATTTAVTGSVTSTGTATVTSKSTLTPPKSTASMTPASTTTASTTTASATKANGGNAVVAGSWLSGIVGVLGMVLAL